MIRNYYLNNNIDADISKEFETNIGLELKNMAKNGTLDPILKAYLFAADRYIRMKNQFVEILTLNLILNPRQNI